MLRTIANLHPDEYSQEFHYYLFAVKLDKCVGSCNTLNDLSNNVCVMNKTEHLNEYVFNMIAGKKWIENLKKYISWTCKCKFDGRKYNSIQKWNDDKCRCVSKYYWRFSMYVWWNHRRSKNNSNKFYKFYLPF